MSTIPVVSQRGAHRSFIGRLSRRNKIMGIALLVVLVLIVVSVPGDRNELIARQERVVAAQTALDLALPAVEPALRSVIDFVDETGIVPDDNRQYTALTGGLSTYLRSSATLASRSPGVVRFSQNAHSLLVGPNAIAELDTDEFKALVANMDTTVAVAWLALWELNDAVDAYNGYQSWISAKVAGITSGLPGGYTDPIPSKTSLTRTPPQ